MIRTISPATLRGLTVIGLAAGATGIALLWASGVEFPFYPPPGLLILAAGALFVALARRWPWAPGMGAFLGLFVIVGFIVSSVVSGEGIGNLTGAAGVSGSIGSVIQLAGAITALVAGVLETRQEYRRP